MIRLPPALGFAALVLCAAPVAQAGELAQLFRALPQAERLAVQRELVRADLLFMEPDGEWSPGTERAVRRSVDALAQKTGDRVHPRLSDPEQVVRFLRALGEGTFSGVLYGGTFLERMFSPHDEQITWRP